LTGDLAFCGVDGITVSLIDHLGTEESVVRAMLVSTGKDEIDLSGGGVSGRISFLMREKHASPFEHCSATFKVDVPIFVAREWHRHRTQSYNETSGRYKDMELKFYVPDLDRPVVQNGKASEYKLYKDRTLAGEAQAESREVAEVASDAYARLLGMGVAREVARDVLPVSLFTQFYATASLRNWLNFLSLRTTEHALLEIRHAAHQVESELRVLFPNVMDCWDKFGRNQL
jgi:thymidylate synthase (FAD)